ncbi:MAG: glycosyltransferase family 2 protein [Specibacter sp.]
MIIPVKNGMPYLPRTISSTLRAMPRDSELLVLDDGSTDGTAVFLGGVKDKRLKVFRNQESAGVAQALNTLLGHATGEHVARMDADDICLPWRFTAQRRALGNSDLLFTGALFINGQGKPFAPKLRGGISAEAMPLHLLLTNPLIHPTMYGRRDVLEGLGGYRQTPTEDYELWLRAAASGSRLKLMSRVPGIIYRRHDAQLSQARAWATEDGDTVLSKSFAALASEKIGYQGSASTILYNRPMPGQPYPEDPDIAAFALLVHQASEGLAKKDRKGVQDRLRSMYRP